jgi:hypothetical protein
MFIFADNHTKNILMKCVSVLSSMSTGWIPIKWQFVRVGFAVSRGNIRLIRVDQDSRSICDYAPRVSTPHFRSFSEIEWVNLVAEVVQVGGSGSKFLNGLKFFSRGLMVELLIFAGFFILQSKSTSKWGGEERVRRS